tara:strand:- start:708 stop:1340 length:633 start_codon:yes stop_codon:yes gene_type:complete
MEGTQSTPTPQLQFMNHAQTAVPPVQWPTPKALEALGVENRIQFYNEVMMPDEHSNQNSPESQATNMDSQRGNQSTRQKPLKVKTMDQTAMAPPSPEEIHEAELRNLIIKVKVNLGTLQTGEIQMLYGSKENAIESIAKNLLNGFPEDIRSGLRNEIVNQGSTFWSAFANEETPTDQATQNTPGIPKHQPGQDEALPDGRVPGPPLTTNQ